LTPTSGDPPSGGEEGAEPGLRNPARQLRKLYTRQLQPPWHYHRKPCVLRPPAESAEPCAGQYALLVRTDAIRPVGVLRPRPGGVGDLIKPSDTPDGPRAGYYTFSGPPQVVSALDATGNDACSTAPNHTFDQLDEGGANAAWGGASALLSPVADNGSAGQRAPGVST
jgi:Bacterial capsule synthesis protein PGA_cap